MIGKTTETYNRLRSIVDTLGTFLVDGFHHLALFAIGGAIVWSAVTAFSGMVGAGGATVRDILLLFIYLELGAMVGIYFKTNHLPVRYLIYVAITVLTRHMIDIASAENAQPPTEIMLVAGAIFVLALAALVLRFGSYKYPSAPPTDQAELASGDKR